MCNWKYTKKFESQSKLEVWCTVAMLNDQNGLYFNSNSIQRNKSDISKVEFLKDLGCVMKNSPGITIELVICGK